MDTLAVIKNISENFNIQFKEYTLFNGRKGYKAEKNKISIIISTSYYDESVKNGAEHISINIDDKKEWKGCSIPCDSVDDAIKVASNTLQEYGLEKAESVQLCFDFAFTKQKDTHAKENPQFNNEKDICNDYCEKCGINVNKDLIWCVDEDKTKHKYCPDCAKLWEARVKSKQIQAQEKSYASAQRDAVRDNKRAAGEDDHTKKDKNLGKSENPR